MWFNGEAAAPLWDAGAPRVERLFSFNGPNVWLPPGAGGPNRLACRPLVAQCHLSLSNLYRRTGKRQEAQEHLTVAATMYREMDIRFWLEQAEGEIRDRT